MTVAAIVLLAVLFIVVLFLISAIKVAREYERGIVFRLGRLFPEPRGPGLFLLIPIVDRMVKVDLRTITLNIPPQEVITKDNVPVRVNAVAYFRIVAPKDAIVQVKENCYGRDPSDRADDAAVGARPARSSTSCLSEREKINAILQDDHRRADRAVGHQGLGRRGEVDVEDPAGHAASDGPPGGS